MPRRRRKLAHEWERPPKHRAIGRLEALAYERHERDLRTGYKRGIYFDDQAADRAVEFVERYCVHSKGRWSGQAFELETWEEFVVRSLFGWKRANSHLRRFVLAYIQLARKQGKTTLAAAIALLLTIADKEAGAEVVSAATTKDQAKLCFDESARMVRKSNVLSKFCDVYGGKKHSRTNTISVEALGSSFEPLSADSDTKDGANIHGAVLDELHKWKDPELFDVIETGTGARTQPLIFAITTPGSGQLGICWEQREHGERVLEKIVEDDDYFFFICEPSAENDAGEQLAGSEIDFTNERTWEQGNPSIDTIVQREDLRKKADRAKELPARENAFRRLNCGQWTEQATRWISMRVWKECGGTFEPEILHGRPCYGGLDLASNRDLNSFVLAFPPIDDRPWTYFLAWNWIPEERVEHLRRTLKQPIRKWVDAGHIETTPGETSDYDVIRKRINEAGELFQIQEIAYDPWNAAQLTNQLAEIDGIEMVKISQGTGGMSAPSKGFERILLKRWIRHGNNPVFTFCAKNVSTWTDANENIKPSRRSSGGKIDTMVAAIMASGRAELHEGGVSIWETEEATG